MVIRLFLFLVLSLTSIVSISQEDSLLISLLMPSELTKNSNAVIRWDDVNIEVKAYNKMVYTNKRIVTILNSSGDSKHGAVMYYDNNTDIKKLEVKIYDAVGKEIKKFRKNDFEDVSAVDGGTLYSDSRLKYLNYTPIAYPYTILFETEVEYSSTAFLPSWRPVESYYTSTQNSNYKIINNSGIEIRSKAYNFEEFNIEKLNDLHYSAKNLIAIKPEAYSPPFVDFTPHLYSILEDFNYEGYKGKTGDWNSLGKWMYDQLLVGRNKVSETTKNKILNLVKGIEDPIKKAKIVYKFVQDNTRYISIQEGIGGIQPIDALKVDEVKYGDCKGLSNYTKALLDIVGVESYYSRVNASPYDLIDIDKEFVSFIGQTNHVIIFIPNNGNNIWLECTSQTSPFGYNANFTDDRDVFVITPEGGKIVHTTVYQTEDNLLNSKASITLSEAGDISASISSKSYGTQFGYHYEIENQSIKDQKLHYKNYWSYINGLDVSSMKHIVNKDSIVFTENIEVNAERYASKTGNRLLVQPNLFNRSESAPQRYQERNIPFEVERGYTDIDEYELTIPSSLEVEALMEDVNIKNEFGEYVATISQIGNNKLIYKRKLIINKGSYKKEDYESFRNFWLDVVKYDKAKIVLITKP